MRKLIRSAAAGAIAASVLLGAAPATAAPAGAPADPRVGRIDWQPCPERPDDPSVRCGDLQVPVDWARPERGTFPLAVAKRAATDPAARIGPLLINPGGPGASGVDAALGADTYFSPEILRRFDVIGFDPRGVARSDAVVCSVSLLAQQPFPVPADQAEYEALVAYNKRLAADCRGHSGPLFDHVDTVSVARDMDAIRAALGERQISYYGVSYGTLIGQIYAERFPDRVRALVVDSNMDHSLSTGGFLRTEAVGLEDSFGQFVAWCDRDASCALHGQDVAAFYDRLMARADAGTLVDPDSGAKLTWLDLSDRALGAFYGPNWSGLAADLAALDGGAVGAGTGERAARPAPVTGTARAGAARAAASAADGAELVGYPLAVFCEDWSLPIGSHAEFSRYLDMSRAVAPHLRASPMAVGVTAGCLGWTKVNNPQHRLRVRTSIPLLVLNSRYDPATPYEWGVAVARQLGDRGRFVAYQGWGHGAYGRTDCVTGHVDRYLVGRALPPRTATCPAAPTSTADGARRATVAPRDRTGLGWSLPVA
ncbi:alpha/beta hydrolase [Micromonospora sp. NPDC049559]|uniref:alpha/beta hydrolase n=1 Tax=Micromonospora sp. NPDC049559 TaxID=3155923 RepID=UPI0034431670